MLRAMSKLQLNIENAVKDRYAAGAQCCEPALCCPVQYDAKYLKVIPQEVIEKDYGCGDPSQHVREGETVLDLGSGTGKICFIASQVVGPKGRVIGVDMTDDMLEVARRNAPIVAERIGFSNVEFRKGRIQDLALDLTKLDAALKSAPISGADAFLKAEGLVDKLRAEEPLVPSASVDVVVSNCVLNLVSPELKPQLFAEIFRVLKGTGRAVISDIVGDEEVPLELQNDAVLWSGCISGALTETGFLQAFIDAGFQGVRILKRDAQPWQTVGGIEFRSVTIEAFKGTGEQCMELKQAVIYKGPFSEAADDDGHVYRRGVREAVCGKTFDTLMREPYAGMFEPVQPLVPVVLAAAAPFDCVARERHPRETKGMDYDATSAKTECCDGGACC